ncbi:MAG: CBS domain-containing protein [Actinoplanes sp.]
MRVRDVMSRPVHTVRPDDRVESAAALMTSRAVTALPVVGADGVLAGMVSEGDLLWHRVLPDRTAHLLPVAAPGARPVTVAEVMTTGPRTVAAADDLAEVAEAMLRWDVRSMPVLDEDGEVVGIVSRRDILRAMVRGDDVLALEVQHRLDEYAGAPHRWQATVVDGVATVSGPFADDTERTVVSILARTVPGVSATLFPPGS